MKTVLKRTGDDSLQLHPLGHPWAWDLFLQMYDNHWSPREIGMTPDVAQWRSGELPENLKHAFLTVFAQLTTFDHQRAVDISEILLPLIQSPEIKHALVWQAGQEANHVFSYQVCIENLGLDQSDIYSRWERYPVLKARVDYANQVSEEMVAAGKILASDSYSDKERKEAVITLAAGIAFWFLAFEGVWFYLNLLGPVQAMARLGLMTATAQQFTYIARDEGSHVLLGVNILRDLIREERISLDDQTFGSLHNAIKYHMMSSLELEKDFIEEAFKGPWVHYSVTDHVEMAKWLINMRMRSMGFDNLFDVPRCPMPWVSEMLEIKKETNFFEGRVTEYRTGNALSWDDDDEG